MELSEGATPVQIGSTPMGYNYPTAIALDPAGGYFYYADRSMAIYKVKLDGTGSTVIYQNDRFVKKLVYDGTGGNLYFTDSVVNSGSPIMESRVRKMKLTSSPVEVTTLYEKPGVYLTLNGLALDPSTGHIYFNYDAMYEGVKNIYRYSDMSSPFVANVGDVFTDLAIDKVNGKLYYTVDNQVWAANLSDGTVGPKSLYTHSTPEWMTDVAYDSKVNKVYFSVSNSSNGSQVYRMNPDGTAVKMVHKTAEYINSIAIMETPPTYTVSPIVDQTMSELVFGYTSGTQEAKSVTITRTGTGVLNNVSASLSGTNASAFELVQPGSRTLDDAVNTTSFMVRAKDGLAVGTYTATVTVRADNMVNEVFTVTQKVSHSYTIAPLANQTLVELAAGYTAGGQESKSVTLTRTGTGVLNNVTAVLSGAGASAFELTQPAVRTLDDTTPSTSFTVKAKDGLAAGTYTANVTVKAANMADVVFQVTQVVHSYTMAPLADVGLAELAAGYGAGTQETKTVTLTRTGTGVLNNVTVVLGGADAAVFELTQPAVRTLDGTTPSTSFTVKAKDGLAAGTYTANVTVKAANMADVVFQVTQVVHSYTMAPLADVGLAELAAGYGAGTQETKTVTLTRTGTGVLNNVTVVLGGADAAVFELTQPAVRTLDGTTPSTSFTVKAKDGLAAGTYTANVTVKATNMADVVFQVTQVVHSYTMAPLADVGLAELAAGYGAGTQEAKSVTLTRTGTGVLNNVTAVLGGADAAAFELTPPGALTLDGTTPSASLTVKAKDGLAAGTYTADVTVKAANMADVVFAVTQVVHSYTITPLTDIKFVELEAGYGVGTQETKTVTITRTGTGLLNEVSASLSGVKADVFELTQPAEMLNAAEPSTTFTVKAKDGLESGTYSAAVTVKAANMTDVVFQVTQAVYASTNADLSSLNLSAIALTPAFNRHVTSYTASVPYETDNTTVTAVTYYKKAEHTLLYRGEKGSGSVSLQVGENRIQIEVTAEDGLAKKMYTVDVSRAPSSNAAIGSLFLEGIQLNESVSASVYQYSATVSNAVYSTALHVSPVHFDATVSAVKLNGEAVNNPIPLLVGSNVIDIEITAQDGTTTSKYTVTVTREASGNAQLNRLDVSLGIIYPAFDPNQYSYSMELPYEAAEASVTAATYHQNARLKVNGELYPSGAPVLIPVSVGKNIVNLLVEAENGVDSANYTLTIQRAASSNAGLSGLALTFGSLTPAFSADQTDYQAEVSYEVSEIAVAATAEHATAVVRVNGKRVESGNPSAAIALSEGKNIISIEVTAQDGLTKRTYTIAVVRQDPPSDDESADSGNSSADGQSSAGGPQTGASATNGPVTPMGLYVNGTYVDGLAKVSTSVKGGKSQAYVTFDEGLLAKQLNDMDQHATLLVTVEQAADEVSVGLTGQAVKALENKFAVLDIRTPNGNYRLPAAEVLIGQISERFDQSMLEAITVQVVVAQSGREEAGRMDRAAEERGFVVAAGPIDFTVTASHNGDSIMVERFSTYIQREIPLSSEADPDKITTAVVLEENGGIRHVPTYITTRAGKKVAVINSMTNSTYALVWNPVQFTDMNNHWGETAVNDLASRMILNGVDRDHFQPNAAITRAEFAAVIVRALGLPNTQETAYHDVTLNDWYAGPVAAAKEYGIINGYEDGTFRPTQSITRQEAMAIMARVTILVDQERANTAEVDSDKLLSTYTDAAQIADWAKAGVLSAIHYELAGGADGQLRPAAEITRVETAAMIQRLLRKAELIDGK